MAEQNSQAQALIEALADQFAALPEVEAIALGGSRAAGAADDASDIDLYVYTRAEIALAQRRAIVEACGGASRADLGLTFWGPGDEWLDAATGIEVDIVYVEAPWIEGHLRQVIHEGRASLGYTTCFWRTVALSRPLRDPRGWLAALQAECRRPYPEALRRNIIALNRPVLRQVIPSYLHQLEKAVARQDLVSVSHRTAALLASYFDILFALSRVLHPGEKRLVAYALRECAPLPHNFEQDVGAVLRAAGEGGPQVVGAVHGLVDNLEALLAQEGLAEA